MEDYAAQKLVHPSLREFASSDDPSEVCSVIVELAAPPQLPPHPLRPPQYAPRAGQRVAIPDLANLEGHADLMEELEKKLQGLGLATPPVGLNAAQAFVVTVTPEQLRTISRWPLVGPIRLNRTHHVSRRAAS